MTVAGSPRGGTVPAALALGSSLGDRAHALRLALFVLGARPDVIVEAASRIYATPPVGGVAAAGFLNAVIRVRTSLAPLALLEVCKAVEARLGRRPTRRWADRVVDIDILLYGDRVVREAGLRVPHPRLAEREFLLAALAEAWPAAKNPWTGLRWVDTLPARRAWPVVGVLPVAREG